MAQAALCPAPALRASLQAGRAGPLALVPMVITAHPVCWRWRARLVQRGALMVLVQGVLGVPEVPPRPIQDATTRSWRSLQGECALLYCLTLYTLNCFRHCCFRVCYCRQEELDALRAEVQQYSTTGASCPHALMSVYISKLIPFCFVIQWRRWCATRLMRATGPSSTRVT